MRVLLCAHLDTVPLLAPVEPVLVDGFWENANEGVLGADNKAALAVMLALARHICREGAPVDVELLFTVCEETALAGSRAFDASRLTSDFGYVFDHASPIGEVVLDSPTHFRIEADFRGAAAHAGIRPEQGRSAILAAARAIAAMRARAPGRADDGERRHDRRRQRDERRARALLGRRGGAQPGRGARRGDGRARSSSACTRRRTCPSASATWTSPCSAPSRAFTWRRARAAVRVAEAALRACGHEPVRIVSGGASDANALLADGVEVVNLANGTERNHEPGERVSVAALEEMLDVALALLDAAADSAPDAAR